MSEITTKMVYKQLPKDVEVTMDLETFLTLRMMLSNMIQGDFAKYYYDIDDIRSLTDYDMAQLDCIVHLKEELTDTLKGRVFK